MDENTFDENLIKFSFEGEKGVSEDLLQKYGKTYQPKQVIIKEGEESDDIYMVYSGSCYVVKLIEDSYKVLNIIHKGELFGEMAVFDEKLRSATIIAKEETVCLKFPKDSFIEVFRVHPRWIDKILGEMSSRIVEMVNKL